MVSTMKALKAFIRNNQITHYKIKPPLQGTCLNFMMQKIICQNKGKWKRKLENISNQITKIYCAQIL